jgi:hypothetical protein
VCWVYGGYQVPTVESRSSDVKSNFGSVEAQFGSQPQTLLRIHQAAPSILINILIGSALPRRSRGRWYRIPYQHHNEQSHRHIVHITATMSAAPAGRAARQLATDLFSPTTQKPLKDRRNTPRRVIRDVVWKAQLPTSQSQVPSQADHAAAATKALAKDPSTSSMARAKAPIGHIMHSLRLKQVSSIRVGANGRLGKRMTANRADKKTARKGLTSKGPGFVVRGTRKNHTDYSFLAGKRRVGAFGIKVSIGHS